jgi:hypothetical protein
MKESETNFDPVTIVACVGKTSCLQIEGHRAMIYSRLQTIELLDMRLPKLMVPIRLVEQAKEHGLHPLEFHKHANDFQT